MATNLTLSDNARLVLSRRYLAKDDDGNPVETPEEMFRRVANNVAQAEAIFAPDTADKQALADEWTARFLAVMERLDFVPNSPTLMNAGREIQQLSACFVLPVPDSIPGIFEAIKETAIIHQSGGGTGFAFSRLRPKGDRVRSTMGVASGPVSFLKVFDAATEAIKQGGTRRGANMGILAVTHPDIEEFISLKSDMRTLTNFNISVAITEEFMTAVERDEEYALTNPKDGSPAGTARARHIFDQIIANAWRNGDPGIVFMDRINRDNPTPNLGEIEATNPCGEQPLLPYESCNLGSLNLGRFVKGGDTPRPDGHPSGRVDWERLAEVIPTCVRFLDDVIEMNRYPIPEIDEATKQTRKIGLGVMGWHDMLFQLGVPYASEEALALGEELMRYIQQKANEASAELARERGVFPAWEGSRYDPDARYRNATRTTVAPTGTISIIADASSGIEPLFALAFTRRHYLDADDPSRLTELREVNKHFLRAVEEGGFYTEELMARLAEGGTISEWNETADDGHKVPEDTALLFVTAHEIRPEWHVRMQAAFQRHTDNAVSKTINFPHTATEADIASAYWLAYREGCKGITIYREGSRDFSVLSHTTANVKGPEQETQAALDEIEGRLSTLSRPRPYREPLPDERRSITHKFRVSDQEGYLTVGLYPDGRPGELFVKINKEGSTVSGLADAVAKIASIARQYGVPLEELAPKLRNTRFEPAGPTGNPAIPWATSVIDYVFHWLQRKFALGEDEDGEPVVEAGSSGVGCPDCGSLLAYQEGCLVCRNCGYNRCG
ncbi:MAG TPA: vitamin B12-dependent ribonucleotide reductase [Dehalococcoidia bacterium]|nr:vitamin B12-dependent ribonucleotide reductase [Dehalococcoidia bacterium]